MLHSLVLAATTFGALAVGQLWLNLDSRSIVTVTFLTLAFAQLWHVFNMRGARSKLKNAITCNPWVWGALGLCTVLLAAPPYIPHLAHTLHLVPPTPTMWAIIAAHSVAPLLTVQAVMHIFTLRSPVTR